QHRAHLLLLRRRRPPRRLEGPRHPPQVGPHRACSRRALPRRGRGLAGVRPGRLAHRRRQHDRPARRHRRSPRGPPPQPTYGARDIRRTATAARADALVLAEPGHDATGDLDGDGWHGTMNYYGFSFPIWEWLRDPKRPAPSFGLPVDLPRRGGPAMVAAMQAF